MPRSLSRLFGLRATTKRRGRPTKQVRPHLRVEALEGRWVPSTLQVIDGLLPHSAEAISATHSPDDVDSLTAPCPPPTNQITNREATGPNCVTDVQSLTASDGYLQLPMGSGRQDLAAAAPDDVALGVPCPPPINQVRSGKPNCGTDVPDDVSLIAPCPPPPNDGSNKGPNGPNCATDTPDDVSLTMPCPPPKGSGGPICATDVPDDISLTVPCPPPENAVGSGKPNCATDAPDDFSLRVPCPPPPNDGSNKGSGVPNCATDVPDDISLAVPCPPPRGSGGPNCVTDVQSLTASAGYLQLLMDSGSPDLATAAPDDVWLTELVAPSTDEDDEEAGSYFPEWDDNDFSSLGVVGGSVRATVNVRKRT